MELEENKSRLWNQLHENMDLIEIAKQIFFLRQFIEDTNKFLSGEYRGCIHVNAGLVIAINKINNLLGATDVEATRVKSGKRVKSAKKKKARRVTLDESKLESKVEENILVVPSQLTDKKTFNCDKQEQPDKETCTKSPITKIFVTKSQITECPISKSPLIKSLLTMSPIQEQPNKTGPGTTLESFLTKSQKSFADILAVDKLDNPKVSPITTETVAEGVKSTRFSRQFKMDRHEQDKMRKKIVNKNPDQDLEERAGQILRDNLGKGKYRAVQWGVVEMSATKVTSKENERGGNILREVSPRHHPNPTPITHRTSSSHATPNINQQITTHPTPITQPTATRHPKPLATFSDHGWW